MPPENDELDLMVALRTALDGPFDHWLTAIERFLEETTERELTSQLPLASRSDPRKSTVRDNSSAQPGAQ